MEINRLDEVIGAIPTADVVEGRFVLLTSHTHNYDFGSKTDLPGIKVPSTAEEANRAKYVVTWAVTQQPAPFYNPYPSMNWALRQGGWDQAANTPFSATVWTTYPGYQNSKTIPSGMPSLAMRGGTFTIPSGGYIYNVNLETPGVLIQVANTAEDTTDAGKAKYLASASTRAIGVVEQFHTSTSDLTVTLFG